MKIRITGKGQNKALIDPLTGHKVYLSSKDKKTPEGPNTALLNAIL